MAKDFPIKGWRLIFYVFGWITGIFNLFCWFVIIGGYFGYDKGKKFFNPNFHKRIYYFGILMAIIFGFFSSMIMIIGTSFA